MKVIVDFIKIEVERYYQALGGLLNILDNISALCSLTNRTEILYCEINRLVKDMNKSSYYLWGKCNLLAEMCCTLCDDDYKEIQTQEEIHELKKIIEKMNDIQDVLEKNLTLTTML